MTPRTEPETRTAESVLERLAARHVRTTKDTMEPDPADPSLIRQTAYCQWCASHRPDEDPRWPCETAALVAAVRAAEDVAGHLKWALDALDDEAFGHYVDHKAAARTALQALQAAPEREVSG